MSRIPNAYNWRKIDTIATTKILSVKVLILKLFQYQVRNTQIWNFKNMSSICTMKASVETDMET